MRVRVCDGKGQFYCIFLVHGIALAMPQIVHATQIRGKLMLSVCDAGM